MDVSIMHRIEIETTRLRQADRGPEHTRMAWPLGGRRWSKSKSSRRWAASRAFASETDRWGRTCAIDALDASGVTWTCTEGLWPGHRFRFDVAPHERGDGVGVSPRRLGRARRLLHALQCEVGLLPRGELEVLSRDWASAARTRATRASRAHLDVRCSSDASLPSVETAGRWPGARRPPRRLAAIARVHASA